MIRAEDAALGAEIWVPDDETAAESNVERFAAYVRTRDVDPGAGYRDLWRWSVDEPERFWALFAEFACQCGAETCRGWITGRLGPGGS